MILIWDEMIIYRMRRRRMKRGRRRRGRIRSITYLRGAWHT